MLEREAAEEKSGSNRGSTKALLAMTTLYEHPAVEPSLKALSVFGLSVLLRTGSADDERRGMELFDMSQRSVF